MLTNYWIHFRASNGENNNENEHEGEPQCVQQ